ncbi:MAG: AP2/ERF family transcription factor [Spirochaetales bacterium]|jgi:hypothetical protein|nr:AP2/ERF family transcription factor [Spirochaetales bacterium]
MKVTTLKHRNICRIDSNNTHGWYARINWNRKQFSKMFSDTVNGGYASALLAAIAWRDRKREELGLPSTDLYIVGATRSNTGIRGVSLDKKRQAFIASWVDAEGRPNNSSVSVRKYGEKAAFEKACAIRAKMEAWRLNGNVYGETRAPI